MTWSSTSCGLCPGQSVKTITWLSDRSGIASMGVAVSAHQPQPAEPEVEQHDEEAMAKREIEKSIDHGHDTRR